MNELPDWSDVKVFESLMAMLAEQGHPVTVGDARPGLIGPAGVRSMLMRLRRMGLDGSPTAHLCLRGVSRAIAEGRLPQRARAWAFQAFPKATLQRAKGEFRARWTSRRTAAAAGTAPARPAPAALAPAAQARIVARCFHNWHDFDDALAHLTPGGQGVWGGVQFTRQAAPRVDWHVVFNHPGQDPVELDLRPNRLLFAIGEPPGQLHRPMHLGQVDGATVLTPDEDMVAEASARRRHVLTPCMTRTWSVRKTLDELRRPMSIDKPGRLSWVTSNLALIEGHRYRLAFLERLRQHMDFELFGRGFRPLHDKWEGIAPFRYSIAFENTSAPYYFTEKLMDCFVAETLPIYYGSSRITEFFPAESMVILDPEAPDALEQIREVVASDLWQRRRDAVLEAKRLTLEKYNLFAQIARWIEDADDEPAPLTRRIIFPVDISFQPAR